MSVRPELQVKLASKDRVSFSRWLGFCWILTSDLQCKSDIQALGPIHNVTTGRDSDASCHDSDFVDDRAGAVSTYLVWFFITCARTLKKTWRKQKSSSSREAQRSNHHPRFSNCSRLSKHTFTQVRVWGSRQISRYRVCRDALSGQTRMARHARPPRLGPGADAKSGWSNIPAPPATPTHHETKW